jgi:urease accessory protein
MLGATALLLADGRFPAGGHAHSGGLEAAIGLGRVRDLDGLRAYLEGRLATAGRGDAALAAAVVVAAGRAGGGDWARLDAEAAARLPAPALRQASRRLGRQLLRAARLVWPASQLEALNAALPDGPHQPVAFGAAASVAGLDPEATALAAAYGGVAGPAAAAVRLLGLDPYAVHRLLAGLAAALEEIAVEAASAAAGAWEDLPAGAAPLVDLAAEQHARWEVRLFAS